MFVMPINPKDFNLFAVEDFLRQIHDSKQRKALIKSAGYSPEARAAYEKQNSLPIGAIELAIMTDDTSLQDRGNQISYKLIASRENPQLQMRALEEAASFSYGLAKRYPQAMRFMTRYNAELYSQRKLYAAQIIKVSLDYDKETSANVSIGANLWVLANLGVVTHAALVFYLAVAIGGVALAVAWAITTGSPARLKKTVKT
ncbi:MAG: hypothetical protein K1X66_03560 [Verrucomicrobiae bacterium]|nr:hypothetical protein [Verrucomicrobiae bacterium]